MDESLSIFDIATLLDFSETLPVIDSTAHHLELGINGATNMLPHACLDSVVKFHRMVNGVHEFVLKRVAVKISLIIFFDC